MWIRDRVGPDARPPSVGPRAATTISPLSESVPPLHQVGIGDHGQSRVPPALRGFQLRRILPAQLLVESPLRLVPELISKRLARLALRAPALLPNTVGELPELLLHDPFRLVPDLFLDGAAGLALRAPTRLPDLLGAHSLELLRERSRRRTYLLGRRGARRGFRG